MKTEFEILSANRSTCNESEAKDMAGCLADGGRVICYFPGEYGMRQASLFAAAPELLAALRALCSHYPDPVQMGTGMAEDVIAARAAITKSTTPNA